MQTMSDDEIKRFADRQRVQPVGQKPAPGNTVPTIDFGACANGGSLAERKRVARRIDRPGVMQRMAEERSTLG